MLDLDSRRCRRPCGRASSSLVTARCRAVQRDGWQQQQRGSGGGGGEEQEKQRSRADAGRKAIEVSSRPPEVLHHSARTVKADVVAFKTVALSEFEDHHWNRTKRDNCSGTNWPNLKVGRHSLCVQFSHEIAHLEPRNPQFFPLRGPRVGG